MTRPITPPASVPRPELLAPAGGPDAGYAALAYGADAVYLGLRRFSARAEAENFGLEELDAFAAYAHSLAPRRRVFAAVNTLVLAREVPEVVALLAALRDVGVDAVIVQDLGVAAIARRHFPSLELHASTQLAVHGRKGVDAAGRLGFRRVVAARELTLREVRDLCGQGDVEVECFVHGAICYSYSGLCLFSSHALGRSANRGRCAYLCGGSFTRDGESSRVLPFAMKDLSLAHRIEALAEAGVTSLKIEGRKKSALYVASVTDFYRGILDRAPEGELRKKEADLRTVFSRSSTELYLGTSRQGGCADPSGVGHRGVAVGTVRGVRGDRRQGRFLRFTTDRPLERHDGLQVELAGFARPYGFAIDELRLGAAGAPRFEVPAGSEVEVRLPPDHPPISVGSPVHCTSSQAVKRAFRWTTPRDGHYRSRTPVDVAVVVRPERVEALVRAVGGRAEARASLEGPLETAVSAETVEASARAAFERLGQTRFSLAALRVENSEALFVSPSSWNRLRRESLEALEASRREAGAVEVGEVLAVIKSAPPEPAGAREPRWSVKVDDPALLDGFAEEDWEAAAEIVVTLGTGDLAGRLPALAERAGGRHRVRLALPAVLRSWDEARLLPEVERLLGEGWSRWEIANLGGWGALGLTPGQGTGALDVTADWPLYATNEAAAAELLGLGLSGFALSPEDGGENWKTLLARFGPRAAAIVYQWTPLFVSETCPHATLAGACPGRKSCGERRLDLTSDFGDRVRAVTRGCRTVLVGRRPFCLADAVPELAAAGASSFRVDLQWADLGPADARDAWRRVRAGERVPESHAGNYLRGLL